MEKISYGLLSTRLKVSFNETEHGNDHAAGGKSRFFGQVIFVYIDQFCHDRVKQMQDNIIGIDGRIKTFAK